MLSAKQDCWVEVSADGETVLNRVLAGASPRRSRRTGEIVLSVGNAGGLCFRVNDRPASRSGAAARCARTS